MKKLLTLLFVLAMVGMAFADVITIGTGTSNTYEPIASYYGYHRSATIYTSGEVGGSGTINTISFKAYNTTTTSIPVKVYMKMTTATTLAPAQSWPTLITGLTPLYEGTFSGTTAGAWKTITLTTPFAYTGTNLEILIESSYGGTGTSGPQWYYTAATNLNQYIRTDDVAPTTEVGYVNGNRPNIQLDMSGYSVFAPSFAVNVPSVAFGNVPMNTTSAYTNITVSNGGAGTLNITSVVLGGTDSGRFILDMNSNPTPWALGAGQSKIVKVAFNPIAAANYSADLQFVGDAKVNHSVALTGSGVDPTVTTFPYNEGFESVTAPALPLGWTVIDNNVDGDKWITSTTNPRTGTNCARLYTDYNTSNDDYLITPPIVLSGNQELKFWTRAQSTGEPDEISVLLSTTTPTAAAFTNVLMATTAVNYITYMEYTVNLSAYTGTAYISFTRKNTPVDGYYLHVDDILIRDIPAAPIFTLSPTTWDFGAKIINTTATKQFSITNTGGGTLDLTSIGITGDYLTLTANGAPASLTAGQSATFTVQYAPTVVGTHTGTVTINDSRAQTLVTLNGSCYDPSISVFPYSESFDGTFPPAGWTNQATVGTLAWDQQTTGTYPTCAPNSGAAMIRYNSFSSSEGNQAIMVTPPLNLTADAYRVKFYMYRDTAYASNTDLVNVYYNNTNSATGATLLGTVNRTTVLAPAVAAAGWYPYIFNLPAAAAGNTGYVVFEAVSAYGNNMFVDDVTVELAPAGAPDNVTLLTPANGSVTVNPANVTLTWSNPATGGPATGYTVFVADDPETIFEQNTYNVNTAPATSFDLDAVLTLNFLDRWYWAVVPNNAGGEADVEDPSFQIFDFTCMADPAITSFPHLQNFDGVTAPALPAMWTTINSGAGNWTNATNVTPFSAPNSMVVYYNSYEPKDEWLITPPVTMQAGVGYNVRFMLKAPGYAGVPEKLALHYGTDATVVAMTANAALYDNANILQATYTEIVAPFTPATTGTYYFGWHAYTDADVDYISVDDVKIELQPQTPVFEITPATTWAFGNVQLANPGVKTFVVKNAGISTLNLSASDISITDDAEGDFTLTANDLPVVLGANETYTFTVTFSPSTVGDKTATLNVMNTYLSVNNTVALTGTAIPEPIGNVVSLAAAVQSNVNVALSWGIAYGTPGTPGWMNWDSGTSTQSIGTGEATTFAVAAKFTAGDLYNYQGMQITKLKFAPKSATSTYTLKIWTGNDIDLAPLTEVYSEAVVSPTIGAYNEITLATPYIVPAGTAVYYGYSIVETGTGFPAGADAGPAVAGKGNLIYWNSVWQELTNLTATLVYNWNIQAYADAIPTRVAGLVKDRTPRPIAVYNAPMTRESQRNNLRTERPAITSRVLRGYNIFRDNVQINSTLVASASYLDLDLAPATYSYSVQAVYYSQNSALSTPVDVTVTYVPPIALPFTEDWATNLFTTNNWTAGATNWNNNSASGNPAPAARFSWTPQVTDYSIPLTSFNFNGVGHSSIKLAFDLSLDNYSTDAINEMTVEVWDGTAWNIVDTFSCLDNDGAGWDFTTNFYDISAYAANREFKVRFVASGEDSFEINYWYLDNITIADLVAPTTAPVVTIAPATTAGSVTLSWDAVTNADWYYVYAGDDPANVTTMLGYTTDITVDLTAAAMKFYKVTAGAGSLPTAPRLGNTVTKQAKK